MLGVGSRPDIDYARELTGLRSQPLDEHYWSPDGSCSLPEVDPFVRPICCLILES